MATVKPRIPGFQDGGNAVEPTTGNDVPVGSLPKEVADDVPAQLSEGEFVLPSDVVRFIGLERLMKMRDEAKAGLQRMAEIGQMGNAEAVGEKADDSFEEEDDEGFESTIDDIMSEMDTDEQTQQAFARGGAVGGPPWLTGYDMKKAPKNPVFDVRYFKHSDGRMMYVTFYNGKPMTPIPDGFTETEGPVEQQVGKESEEEKKKVVPAPAPSEGGDGVGVSGPSIDVEGLAQGTVGPEGLAQGTTVSPAAIAGIGVLGTALGIPGSTSLIGKSQAIAGGMTNMSGTLAGQQNINAMAQALGVDPSTPEGLAAAASGLQNIGENFGQMQGVVAGSQSAAMSAGIAAATAAEAAGLNSASQAAASQAAVNAVTSGVDPETAINDAVLGAISDASPDSPGDDGDGSSGVGGSGVGAAGGTGTGSAGVGPGWAKGGLIARRKQPAKKQKKKGLATR